MRFASHPRTLATLLLLSSATRSFSFSNTVVRSTLSVLFMSTSSSSSSSSFSSSSPTTSTSIPSTTKSPYVRADGIHLNYDPYTPEMRSKYGAPGQTDREGFDPYADRVGPGIYGGHVKRDECGRVIYGEQYQNHNPRPGPVYAGGGYTPIVQALGLGQKALEELLDACPEAVNEVSTGGATPLHMAGMSKRNQEMTEILIRRGGNIEAVDTYGYRPLHRMASNNLAVGAKALLKAGADPKAIAGTGEGVGRRDKGETPMAVARSAGAWDVVQVLLPYYSPSSS